MIIVIPGAASDGQASKPTGVDDRFVLDLTIEQYRQRYDPEVSSSSVADWCREGAFPTTVDSDGELIPGAYKRGKTWYITQAGIEARQRKARADWLREQAPRSYEPSPAHTGETETAAQSAKSAPTKRSPKRTGRRGKRTETIVRRARQDAWKEVRDVA